MPIIFPVHPRTRKTIADLGLAGRIDQAKNLRLIDPLGYIDFLGLYSIPEPKPYQISPLWDGQTAGRNLNAVS